MKKEETGSQSLRERCETIKEILGKTCSITIELVGPAPAETDGLKESSCIFDELVSDLIEIQDLSERTLDRATAIINAV